MLGSARGWACQRGLVVRRFVVLFVVVLAFVLAPWPATAAPAGNFPAQIDLPNGFFPEGIDSGRGTSFFVGSFIDGAIWRGDLRTGSRTAQRGASRSASPTRLPGTGYGWRVADPASWVPVTCGCTTH